MLGSRRCIVPLVFAWAACSKSSPEDSKQRTLVPPETPRHGLVYEIGGLGSRGPAEIWYRFDLDTRVLMRYAGPLTDDEMTKAARFTLSADAADALWERAKAVLHAGGEPETEHASDYTQRLVINDNGTAMDVTGDGPFVEARAKGLADELVWLSR